MPRGPYSEYWDCRRRLQGTQLDSSSALKRVQSGSNSARDGQIAESRICQSGINSTDFPMAGAWRGSSLEYALFYLQPAGHVARATAHAIRDRSRAPRQTADSPLRSTSPCPVGSTLTGQRWNLACVNMAQQKVSALYTDMYHGALRIRTTARFTFYRHIPSVYTS
ncbi:hypothetical protein VTK26DRAFT_3773 [Humicola hyalothermophila]